MLVVLVALGAGVSKVGGALFGADGTVADGGTDITAASAPADRPGDSPIDTTGDGSTLGSAVDPATSSPSSIVSGTVDTTPHVPTADNPAVVLIAGDSDAGTFGPYLEKLLGQTGVARSKLEYEVSTGLARPDALDWPAKFHSIIPSIDPDIVIVTFGGNDAQGLAEAGATSSSANPPASPVAIRSGVPSTENASARSWTTCRQRAAR